MILSVVSGLAWLLKFHLHRVSIYTNRPLLHFNLRQFDFRLSRRSIFITLFKLIGQRGLPDFLRKDAVFDLVASVGVSLTNLLFKIGPGFLVFAHSVIKFFSFNLEASCLL